MSIDKRSKKAQGFSDFLLWERSSRDTIDVKKTYIDIAQDLIAGIMLSQIIYWHLPAKDGTTKMRVEKEGSLWIAKARASWWDECRLTEKQVDRALAILEKLGIIEVKIWLFDNKRTPHIRVIEYAFLAAWSNAIALPSVDAHVYRTRPATVGNTGKKRKPKDDQIPYQETSKFPNRKDGNSLSGNIQISKEEITVQGTENTPEITSKNTTTKRTRSSVVDSDKSSPVSPLNGSGTATPDEIRDLAHQLESHRVSVEGAAFLASSHALRARMVVAYLKANPSAAAKVRSGGAVRSMIAEPEKWPQIDEWASQPQSTVEKPRAVKPLPPDVAAACERVYARLHDSARKAVDEATLPRAHAVSKRHWDMVEEELGA
jgi:hypothetical protein